MPCYKHKRGSYDACRFCNPGKPDRPPRQARGNARRRVKPRDHHIILAILADLRKAAGLLEKQRTPASHRS